MKKVYILDACALVAVLRHEPGAAAVLKLLKLATDNQATLLMHKVNFYEVYYQVYRYRGETGARQLPVTVQNMRIGIETQITDELIHCAAKLKFTYHISLGDSFGVATAALSGGVFVTADHHELDAVAAKEKIDFLWFR